MLCCRSDDLISMLYAETLLNRIDGNIYQDGLALFRHWACDTLSND